MTRKHTVRDGYDSISEAYLAERRPDGRERELVESFATTLPGGARVLDAGCGAGVPVTATLVDRHEVVGLDASAAQLTLARDHVSVARLVRGDLERLPFADGAFDGLASCHAVIHVPRERHGDVLREFHRVLRSGGRLLVTLGIDPWEGTNPDWLDAGTEMFWSYHGRERNLELLAAAGFTVERETVVDDELGGEWLFVRAVAGQSRSR